MAKLKNNYFPALTGLRAIAAYMVYIVHYNLFNASVFGQYIFNFFNEFQAGVTVFFVLSGFLIAYRYFDEKELNLKRYFVNRIARIYPMYFIITTAFFIYKNSYTINDFWLYLSNITFIKGFFNSIVFSGIGQGWTLSVEESFYLFAPIIFIVLRKYRLALIWLPLVFISTGILLVKIFQGIDFYGFMNSFSFMFEMTFFGRCFEFFVGIALAMFIKKHLDKFKTKYATYFGVLFLVICIFCISLTKGSSFSGMDSIEGKIINSVFLPLFGLAPLIWGLTTEKTLISKILETKLFTLLGKSSYVFYLIHLGVFGAFVSNSLHNYLLTFFIINVVSILLYKYLEEPLNNLVKSTFK